MVVLACVVALAGCYKHGVMKNHTRIRVSRLPKKSAWSTRWRKNTDR